MISGWGMCNICYKPLDLWNDAGRGWREDITRAVAIGAVLKNLIQGIKELGIGVMTRYGLCSAVTVS